jgi:hypothetical protein
MLKSVTKSLFTTVLFSSLIIFSACNRSNKFTNKNSDLLINDLQAYLNTNSKYLDDPFLYDSLFNNTDSYSIKVSDPFWVIPSNGLDKNIKIQKSNNNVSICLSNGKIYIAFRTGPFHFASKKTGLYVISSKDLLNWDKEFDYFDKRDVREPLLIEINDTLHLYFFSSGTKITSFKPEFISHYIFIDNEWKEMNHVLELNEVHWEMKKRMDKYYLSSYIGGHYQLKGESHVNLCFKNTTNGFDFFPSDSSRYVYHGGVSETAFEFDKDKNLWAVTRLEDGDRYGFGSQVAFASKDDYQNWKFSENVDPHCYMSPKMFRHQDDIYLIARKQLGKKPFGKAKRTLSMKRQRLINWIGFSLTPKTTALYKINKEKMKVEWIMDLAGCGDTAFPSIQRIGKDKFLFANYSSPIKSKNKRTWLSGQFGKTGIYLSIISFNKSIN